jgi:3-hydroxyisobutyrate dehydrogenase-like beta-hydroxyacid dehydrogenase
LEIGFIGFGEAGRAFQKSIAAHEGAVSFRAFDILLDSQGRAGECGLAMQRQGVAVADEPAVLAAADWVFSAVTADSSLEAAHAACAWLRPGQVFFDINSVSPARKRESAERVGATGAAYVDMAVMAPVHPKGHRTPVLLAGAVGPDIESRLKALDFAFETVGPDVGAATAIKMVRSLFVKGLEAITVEALLAASASGCLDHVMKSLSGSFPGLGWPQFARYEFERTTTHGRRRAAEMRESARTLAGLGLHAALADAIADVQDAMGAAGGAELAGDDLAEAIAAIARRRQILA